MNEAKPTAFPITICQQLYQRSSRKPGSLLQIQLLARTRSSNLNWSGGGPEDQADSIGNYWSPPPTAPLPTHSLATSFRRITAPPASAMAAPGASAGGRRASASRPRRASAAAVESNENDDLAAAPSSSSSALAHPAASVPHFSLPPRSPLAAIADPERNPRSAPVTPKSLAGTPRACAAGTGARDRTSSIGTARRVFDLRDVVAPEVPLEVPHFELDEDPAFWKDRNVQVWVSIA